MFPGRWSGSGGYPPTYPGPPSFRGAGLNHDRAKREPNPPGSTCLGCSQVRVLARWPNGVMIAARASTGPSCVGVSAAARIREAPIKVSMQPAARKPNPAAHAAIGVPAFRLVAPSKEGLAELASGLAAVGHHQGAAVHRQHDHQRRQVEKDPPRAAHEHGGRHHGQHQHLAKPSAAPPGAPFQAPLAACPGVVLRGSPPSFPSPIGSLAGAVRTSPR